MTEQMNMESTFLESSDDSETLDSREKNVLDSCDVSELQEKFEQEELNELKNVLEKERENYIGKGEVNENMLNNFDRILNWLEGQISIENQNENEQLERLGQEEKELAEYFDIDIEVFATNQKALDDYVQMSGLSESRGTESMKLERFLSSYKDYIEENLSGADQEMVNKIKETIGIRATQVGDKLGEKISSLSSEYEGARLEQELRSERWNVNRELNELFEFVDMQVLPTAVLLDKVDKGQIQLPDREEVYTQEVRGRAGTREVPVEGREQEAALLDIIEEGKRMFNSDIGEDGDFERGFQIGEGFGKAIFDEWDIANGLDDGSRMIGEDKLDQTKMLEYYGVSTLDTPSILDEEDQKLEAEVMTKYMAFVMTMFIPYIGAGTSVPTDLNDMFGDEDGVTSTMKTYGFIPEEYKMDGEWYDTVLASVGLVGQAIGMVPIVGTLVGGGIESVSRSPKLARAMNILQRSGIEKEELSTMISKHQETIKQRIFGSSEDPSAQDVENAMKNPESRSGLSREQVIENSRWMEENPDLPNELMKENGLDELNQEQMEVVRHVHENISKGIYQNEQEDLMMMARELRQIGITREQTRVLMENGITGQAAEVIDFYRQPAFDPSRVEKNKELIPQIYENMTRQEMISEISSKNGLGELHSFFGDIKDLTNSNNVKFTNLLSEPNYWISQLHRRGYEGISRILPDELQLPEVVDKVTYELNVYILENIRSGKSQIEGAVGEPATAKLNFDGMSETSITRFMEKYNAIDVLKHQGVFNFDINGFISRAKVKSLDDIGLRLIEQIEFSINKMGFNFKLKNNFIKQSNEEILDSIPGFLKDDQEFVDLYLELANYDRFINRPGNLDFNGMSEGLKNKLSNNMSFIRKKGGNSGIEGGVYGELGINSFDHHQKTNILYKLLKSDNIEQEYNFIKRVLSDLELGEQARGILSFNLRHSQQSDYLKNFMKESLSGNSSREREWIVYKDFITLGLKSFDRGMESTINKMRTLNRIETSDISDLSRGELEEVIESIKLMIYSSKLPNREEIINFRFDYNNLEESIESLRGIIRAKPDQALGDRMAEIFFGPIGIRSIEQVYNYIHDLRQDAMRRGIHTYKRILENGGIENFSEGDLVRQFNSDYFESTLINGSLSNQMFYSGRQGADNSPYDVDFINITKNQARLNFNKGGLDDLSENPDHPYFPGKYGDIYMVIKNSERNINFLPTRNELRSTNYELPSKMRENNLRELVYSNVGHGNETYIRTGVAPTEVSYYIAPNDPSVLENMKKDLAEKGIYTPIVDRQGNPVFSPEEYSSLRNDLGLENNLPTSSDSSTRLSREQVVENSKWMEENPDLPNELMKENGLDELSQEQMEVVRHVHENISKGIYQNEQEDLMMMARELRQIGITREQTRVLMENGITGKASNAILRFFQNQNSREQLTTFPELGAVNKLTPGEDSFTKVQEMSRYEIDIINNSDKNLDSIFRNFDDSERYTVESLNTRANLFIESRLLNINKMLDYAINHPGDLSRYTKNVIDNGVTELVSQMKTYRNDGKLVLSDNNSLIISELLKKIKNNNL